MKTFFFKATILAIVTFFTISCSKDKNSTNGTSTDSWNMKNGVFQLSAGFRF